MENQTSQHKKLVRFAYTAILAAVIIVLTFTPLGYFKFGIIEITILMLPVAIGAVAVSPAAGALLGLIFGLTSLWTCVSGSSVFGQQLFQISVVSTVITCIIPRVLAGLLCGLIAKAIKNKTLSAVVGCFCASALNTVLFTGTLLALFSKTEYIANMIGGRNILAFAVVFVGINGLVEIVAVTFLGAVIVRALDRAGL